MELSRDRSRIAALGRGYGAAGRKDDALRIVAELVERSKECYVTPYVFALIYASMDEKDEALGWLQKACDEGVSDLIYLRVDPFLDNLRSDPRFATLLESVGFGP